MKSLSLSLRSIPGILFVSLALTLMASAQAKPPTDPALGFYEMTKAAPAAFSRDETERASLLAEQLLKESEKWKENWNYGNAIHAANNVLGRVALKNGEIDQAKKFLLAAGKTPGSPQLNSFGPDMNLAKDLLAKGEKEIVLEYFALCSKFWNKTSQEMLEKWTAQVKAGEIPDFGANLKYLGF